MAKLLIVHALNNLLTAWEDCNLYADFLFHMRLIDKRAISEETSVHIGSELTPLGTLGRPIPDYENLRKVLMGYPHMHENNFMPRIPKTDREYFKNSLEIFNDFGYMLSILQVPRFLLKWNETRKACVVEDSLPIPMVDLQKENWLNKLPYESFFLKVSSPLVFPKDEKNEESIMDTFLIHNGPDLVHILGWPHKEEDKHRFTADERKKISDDIRRLKKRKQIKQEYANTKAYGWLMMSFAIVKPKPEPTVIIPDWDSRKMILVRPYDQYSRISYKQRAVLEMLNGFCKLMATLPPGPSVKIEDTNTTREKPHPPRQWFELPQQTIEYLRTEKLDDIITIKRGIGSEKSPHIRRAHTRRIVGNDGKVTEVWIDQITVREDKLLTQQLQGGAISLK